MGKNLVKWNCFQQEKQQFNNDCCRRLVGLTWFSSLQKLCNALILLRLTLLNELVCLLAPIRI